MTENEAIKVLVTQKQCIDKSSSGQCKINCGDCKKNIPIAYQEKSYEVAITALKEVQRYREIGTVEECRKVMEKLKRAEAALSVILSGNYNDECNFCVHNDNPMANCQCICGDGSWCIHNAKWNGKTSEDENLEGMEDE